MAAAQQLDSTQLKAFSNAAAGHDGVLSDESGEMIIKPCTDSEIEFYQNTRTSHPDFAELMPMFLGTLSLGEPSTTAVPMVELSQEQKDVSLLHGTKIATQTAIVLENLEHGFKQANVLDLKLGARLYADGTSTKLHWNRPPARFTSV
jgi:1D-myo-inositol-tetrakisphosphate 5-kinase/inositol-polyphosphate multikinase